VTYKEDKTAVTQKIQELVHQGIYPENLWEREEKKHQASYRKRSSNDSV